MKHALTWAVLLLSLLCLLCACSSAKAHTTDPTSAPTETTAPLTQPTSATTQTQPWVGWQEEDGLRYYQYEDGTYAVGWLDLDGNRYYLDQSGILQTGWLELDGSRYYLRPDGTMARGKMEIDGTVYYFTSGGSQILLVNPWNQVPEDYTPELVSIGSYFGNNGSQIDRSCYDALVAMMEDCNQHSGARVYIVSAYRSQKTQSINYNRKVNAYLSAGYSREEAQAIASTVVAVPGTSEHQLGLAVDIIDTRLWSLSNAQADLPGQQWLMENCWRYGFILRYPEDKTDVTGIIYEPWHYRYVGPEVAAELHESGLTLEEYLESLS